MCHGDCYHALTVRCERRRTFTVKRLPFVPILIVKCHNNRSLRGGTNHVCTSDLTKNGIIDAEVMSMLAHDNVFASVCGTLWLLMATDGSA